VYGEGDIEKSACQYLTDSDTDREDLITKYAKSISDLAPKSWNLMINVLRVLHNEHNIVFPKTFWKKLKNLKKGAKGNQAITPKEIPTNRQIRELISKMSIQGKTLFSLISSSGMRIGETLQLEESDINVLPENILEINLRGDYTKSGRKNFSTLEVASTVSS